MKHKLLLIIIVTTIVFCFAIAFDVSPYLRGPAPYFPEWRWEYYFVNTLSRIWAPVLVIFVILCSVYKTEQKTEKQLVRYEKQILLLSVILLLLLQFAVLYFSRAGVGVMLQRIIHPDANGYFTAAIQIKDLYTFINTYNDTVLFLPQHAQGHPPAAVLFFYLLELLLKPFSSLFYFLENISLARPDVSAVWHGLSLSQKVLALFSTVFIPFLSSLCVVPLYYVSKNLYSIRAGFRSIFLYMTIPSILLFIPINDVFLGFFVMTSFLLYVIGIKRKSLSLLGVSGFLFMVTIFFSLSVLPLLFIFLVFLFFQKKSFKKIFVQGIIFTMGMIVLPICLYLFFGYNTIEVSKTIISGLPEHRSYPTWVFYNLYDFFVFAGIPIFILFCFVGTSIFHKIPKEIKKLDVLTVGFIGMLVILDISGSVRGEVARIWLPFYPFLVLIIANVVTHHLKYKPYIFALLLCLQFIQVLVMQEFWVMLW